MCPTPILPPDDIGLYWTDEELFTSLDKIIHGSPLPANVIQDVDPYQTQPSCLPDGIWYLINAKGKKDAAHGFWKPKGETSDIFTNSTITGRRTTLEFYEGQVPNERRTNWVMQEYAITQKALNGDCNPKDCRSLCRVFLSDQQDPINEITQYHSAQDTTTPNLIDSTLSTYPDPASTSGQDSTSRFQAKNRSDDPSLESVYDIILRGDYLEMDDIMDDIVDSASSSSDNTSCLSFSSEEYFDSLALLRDIEQGKDSSFKYTASAFAKPREVIMHPPTLGSLDNGCESKLSIEETQKSNPFVEGEDMPKRLLGQTSKQENEGSSNSENVATTRSTNKSHVGGMKKLKKYLCFI